jgi:O-methyltransferase
MYIDIEKTLERICGAAYSTKYTVELSYTIAALALVSDVDGDFVECGVGAGSQIGAMGLALKNYKWVNSVNSNTRIWAYDSYLGIPLAGPKDETQPGIGKIIHDVKVPERELLKTSGVTVHSLNNVKTNLVSWGMDINDYVFVEGWFQDTLKTQKPEKIAILRLDGDLYESTKVCLEELFPRLVVGGILIIDDWALKGCRVACDEFFGDYSDLEEIDTYDSFAVVNDSTPAYFRKVK